MEVIREISKLSNFKPKNPVQKAILRLAKKQDLTKKEAKKSLLNRFNNSQLTIGFSRLKYNLLDGVVNVSFLDIPKSSINRVRIWKRHLQIKILFLTGNRISAVSLAKNTICQAEKSQDFEVVESLCKDLMLHYTNNEPIFKEYQKYRDKFEQTNNLFQALNKAELAYQELVNLIKNKQSLEPIRHVILELDEVANNFDYYRFKNFYFLLKSLYFRTNGNNAKFIENNKAAYEFFNKFDTELSYLNQYNFLSELIPHYIFENDFINAGSAINQCEKLPPKGSFNWHRILVYKSYLGFYSEKPKAALSSLKLAFSVKAKFDSPIFERWHIIEGYLAIFHLLGKVHQPEPFKLRKYLNIEEKKDNHEQKANLLIIELLYLLFDGKRPQYFEATEKLDHYIQTRFKPHKFKRTRYFLRMLKSVVRGNYHPVLTKAHAKVNLKKLETARVELDANVLDIEYVPYEMLWGMVVKFLGKN